MLTTMDKMFISEITRIMLEGRLMSLTFQALAYLKAGVHQTHLCISEQAFIAIKWTDSSPDITDDGAFIALKDPSILELLPYQGLTNEDFEV